MVNLKHVLLAGRSARSGHPGTIPESAIGTGNALPVKRCCLIDRKMPSRGSQPDLQYKTPAA
jgi:hypothetical protein